MAPRMLLTLVILLFPLIADAQAPVYQSTGKDGPVFSDQPSPGARQIDLPPVNIIQVTGAPAAPPTAPPDAAPVAAYTELKVVSPANGATIWTNTGAFDLQVLARPALQTGRGDAFRVKIDGQALPKAYSGPAISIAQTDWARDQAADNVLHSLQVSIVNPGGAVQMESAAVQFYLRRHTTGATRASPR